MIPRAQWRQSPRPSVPILSGNERAMIASGTMPAPAVVHRPCTPMSKQVVARFQDGRLLKGTSLDVGPARPTFHIRPQKGPVLEVRLQDLKALFFVRSLDGDPQRIERKSPDPGDPRTRGSRVIGMRFADGEFMVGLTVAYPPRRDYFFALPVDQHSNNIRVLVNKEAVVSMTPLQLKASDGAPDASVLPPQARRTDPRSRTA